MTFTAIEQEAIIILGAVTGIYCQQAHIARPRERPLRRMQNGAERRKWALSRHSRKRGISAPPLCVSA